MFIKSFLADIRAATDVETLVKVIAEIGAAFGYDDFVYASWPSNWWNNSKPDTIVSFNGLLRPFEASITAAADDSFVGEAMGSTRPIHWDGEAGNPLTPLTGMFARLGYNECWAKGERDSNNNRGLVCFLRFDAKAERGEVRDDYELVWLSYIIHLHGGELFARKRLAKLATGLSARECEVLRWTGYGKTSEEISSILAISKKTVNFHVKNACLKLGCANKTATVVTAMTLGLL